MVRTVLVPLDGSELAGRALPFAVRLARAGEGRLVLLRAAHARTLPGTDAAPGQVAAVEHAEDELGAVAEQIRAYGITTEPHVYYDDPAVAIVDGARRQRADLIVMSTHGRGGLGRWLYGSVADRVIRQSEVPVLLVPAVATRPWPRDSLLRILLPLDGSELAEAAIGPAETLAGVIGARLTVLRVVVPPPPSLYGEGYAFIPFDQEAELTEARKYLDEVADRLRTSGRLRDDGRMFEVRTAVGEPVAEIAEAARQGADVIAMATHGEGGLARLLMGSVATGVLQRAGVPLLLVRPTTVHEQAAPAGAGAPVAG
jgi:nucleotide-binding universal stress UspA family protein